MATVITVTGTLVKTNSSSPASGTVDFALSQTLHDTVANRTYPTDSRTVTLDANGAFSIDLIATDDPDMTPTGGTYTVTIRTGGTPVTYAVEVPYDAVGATADLADLVQTSASLVYGVSQATLDAHAADTTSVHGIADTSALVTTGELGALSTSIVPEVNEGVSLGSITMRFLGAYATALYTGLMRDTASATRMILNGSASNDYYGREADDASAAAHRFGNGTALTNAAGKIASFFSDGFTTERFAVYASGKLSGIALQSPPSITGSRGGNAALASLLTELETLGVITDDTTA